MKTFMKIASTLLLAVALSAQNIQSGHTLTVFDPANYGQNLLTAARNLQQINNQVIQLQNEAQMLINQNRNLTNLPTSVSGNLQNSLARVENLVRNAQNIAYQVSAIDAHFQRLYPQRYAAATTSSQIFQDGQEAWNVARQGLQHSMHVQATVIEEVRRDSVLMARLVAESQGAVGNLQVAQAGNQLAALNAKQSMQLQTLLAASARADALDRAAKLAAKEQARARFQNFLGDRQAYTH